MKMCGKHSYGRCSWPGACWNGSAASEPVTGHLKEHHRMGRNYRAHASGDAINAVLAAAGYNFRRLLAWLRLLLLRILIALSLPAQPKSV